MQQTLAFFDHTLAQQHPSFIGMLRVSLLKAKHGTDLSIIKLYIIVLTILPMNVLVGMLMFLSSLRPPGSFSRSSGSDRKTGLTRPISSGLFSLNVNAPTEGVRYTHTISDDDLTPAGFNLFYYILMSVVILACLTLSFVWVLFQISRRTLRMKQERRQQQATVS